MCLIFEASRGLNDADQRDLLLLLGSGAVLDFF
jgi:hypothetical protein